MATLKITSLVRRMVLDRDYYEAVGEYVRAVDRLREIERRGVRQRPAHNPVVYHHEHDHRALSPDYQAAQHTPAPKPFVIKSKDGRLVKPGNNDPVEG